MDFIKNISIEDLKKDYSGNHGFVFLHSNISSDQSIGNLALLLKNQGISRGFPILVSRLPHGIAFVYEDFDAPYFFSVSDQIQQMTGIEIIPLFYYLQQV